MTTNGIDQAQLIRDELNDLNSTFDKELSLLNSWYASELKAIQANCPHNEGFDDGWVGRFCKICGCDL